MTSKLTSLLMKWKENKRNMAQHTRTGRGQYRVEADEKGKRVVYMVRSVGGNRVFTMKVDDTFYEHLDKIIERLPEGAWSYAAVVRSLIAEEAGGTDTEVIQPETGVRLKVRMPRKEITREAPPISKGKTVLEQLGEEFPPEVVERLAKVGEAKQRMCLGKTEEQVEVALKAWGV